LANNAPVRVVVTNDFREVNLKFWGKLEVEKDVIFFLAQTELDEAFFNIGVSGYFVVETFSSCINQFFLR
jgi:hypothetical protein